MKVIKLDEIEKTEMMMEGARDVWKQIPISRRDGTPSFSFRVFSIMPGGHTPYHTHDFEHLNYVIEGEGALVRENGEEQVVNKGDFVLVLPDEKHQYRNRSPRDPMVMICAVPKEYE